MIHEHRGYSESGEYCADIRCSDISMASTAHEKSLRNHRHAFDWLEDEARRMGLVVRRWYDPRERDTVLTIWGTRGQVGNFKALAQPAKGNLHGGTAVYAPSGSCEV